VLVLHRLLMDYWNECNKTTISNLEEEKARGNFVTFAKQWMDSNKITSASFEMEDGQSMELEHVARIAQHPEVSPVAAVLGGLLGNEVIKSLTRKGEPANNVLMFTGLDGGCRSFVLQPEK
jgi:ubiquitin-like 1-activating enzyme E1 A